MLQFQPKQQEEGHKAPLNESEKKITNVPTWDKKSNDSDRSRKDSNDPEPKKKSD